MVIVSKFYSVTGLTEHWMIVDGEWKSAYLRWNLMQSRLTHTKGIEPLWITTTHAWETLYHGVGKTVGAIGRPGDSVLIEARYFTKSEERKL